ncbi:MAG: FTR1 family protein [Alphaproteobacteria bacterium]|nr:FTR1 family protein [Alphaproteobacteria bacterium]
MFASALIVFREVLEAALVLSIVAAATNMVAGRNRWLALGVVGGVAGAVVVAAFAGAIAEALEGVGQEIFNAVVLLLAVAMLGWHNIWMQRHGRELAAQMSAVGSAVAAGSRPLYAVSIAVGLAVLREGAEVVLFLYGIASGGANATELALGSAVGLALGAIAGLALYAGLLKLSSRYLFTVTSWMILLLAAGMAATAAKYLSQADVLPALGLAIWDTSAVLSEDGVLGQVLHVLIGYVARPSGIQLIFYISTIVLIGGLMFALNPRRRPVPAGAGVAAVLLASVFAVPMTARDAQAGFKVYSPYVEYREFEIEYRPSVTVDSDGAKDNEQKHLLGIGYGVTEWWFTEIYVEWEREAGSGEELNFEAFEWENKFQLTNPGEYWADFGLLVEYERTDSGSSPDELAVSLLFAKELGKFDATYNLEFAREIGNGAGNDVELAHRFQLKYRLDPAFEPAIEVFSEFGPIDDLPGFDEQAHYVGPAFAGKIPLGDSGLKLKYNAGYLFGVSDGAEDGIVKAIIEIEVPL